MIKGLILKTSIPGKLTWEDLEWEVWEEWTQTTSSQCLWAVVWVAWVVWVVANGVVVDKDSHQVLEVLEAEEAIKASPSILVET